MPRFSAARGVVVALVLTVAVAGLGAGPTSSASASTDPGPGSFLAPLLGAVGALVTGQNAAPATADLPEAVRPARGRCRSSFVPVSLAEGQAVDQMVWAQLCLPRGARPKAVQLLVHGCLYNGSYWEFPDPRGRGDRYHYVDRALAAGYATLTFDMVGAGRSTHPPSARLTVPAGVWIIDQLVQGLRAGTIPGPGGRIAFSKVIEVSHSFGTFFSWLHVNQYGDVDAAIFTGATHRLAFAGRPFQRAITSLGPAFLNERFGAGGLDPGYLAQDTRLRHLFYDPAPADPAVIAADAATSDLLAATELAAFPLVLATPLDIRVPVLIVLGENDPMFCHPTASDCSSARALGAQERKALGPAVPSVDTYLLPGAGHALNLMPNAGRWFDHAQRWAAAKVPAR